MQSIVLVVLGSLIALFSANAAAQEQPAERGSALAPVLGLLLLTGLAYLAGLPRLRKWERKLGLSQAISAGLPFVALGFAAREAGVLSPALLEELGAVLRIALGWTGFLVGLRFRSTSIERTSKDVSLIAGARVLCTLALVAGVAMPLLARMVSGQGHSPALRANQALTLGLAAAITSFVTPRLLSERGTDKDTIAFVHRVIRVEELFAIAGLLLVTAYFRSPASSAWPIPGGAWVLLTLGLGTGAGLFANTILGARDLGPEQCVLLSLGVVCFTSGAAGYLELSPIVVGFVAGSVLGALPGERETILLRTLAPLDHAITLVLLVFVGAYLDVSDPGAWLLALAFVPARLAGKWLGTWAGTRLTGLTQHGDPLRVLVISPLGSLGIAIVVNTHALTETGALPEIAVAVVVAALVTELLMQAVLRAPRRERTVATLAQESR